MVTITAVALSVRQPNRPPDHIVAMADRETVVVPDSVGFTAQATDPDGDVLTYSWDFGDGTIGSGNSPNHSYAMPGWYIVLLTVMDGKGGVATNDGNLTFIHVLAAKAESKQPSPPSSTSCPVSCLGDRGLAVLAANQSIAGTGAPVRFTGNASWAYLWTWNNATNASSGGQFTLATAADYPSLFSFNFTWDDGSAKVTGPASMVGVTTHAFSSAGNHFVQLNASVGGLTRSAGYTVRVTSGAAAAQLKDPGIFVSATAREPTSLDPAVADDSASGEVLQNTYDTLVWYPPGLESVSPLAPRLATVVPTIGNGGISPDGKNYTFHLRSDVVSHNNTAMDARSVAFTFRRVLAIHSSAGPSRILERVLTNTISAYPGTDCNPAVAGRQYCTIGDWVNRTFAVRSVLPGYILAVLPSPRVWDTTRLNQTTAWAVSNSTVEATGNLTVVFHLLQPYAAFLPLLAAPVASVVSQACVSVNGGILWGVRNGFLDRLGDCGSGPFRLSFVAGEQVPDLNQVVKLTRFDGYWRGAAALREVDILPIRDVLSREFMLLAGNADSAAIDRAHQWDVMRPDGTPRFPTLRIVKDRPAFTMSSFGFNRIINATAAPSRISILPTFFGSVHVRRAFMFSFDYSRFIQNVTLDSGIQPRGPIPQGLPGYNASIPLSLYDLARASAELQNTTYWASGFNLTLYYRAGNAYEQSGSSLLATGLQALHSVKGSPGAIVVQVRPLDSLSYSVALHAGGLPLALLSWTPRFADPLDSVTPFLRTGNPFPTWIRYSNRSLDGLIDAASGQLNDTTRERDYEDLSARAVLDDVPYLWAFQATNFHVERTWFLGYYFNPMLFGLDYYPLHYNPPTRA